MTDEELIAWVRNGFGNVAADRIEELRAELEAYRNSHLHADKLLLQEKARAERLEAALREILEKPRNADLTYAELFAEVVSEARAALKGDDHE